MTRLPGRDRKNMNHGSACADGPETSRWSAKYSASAERASRNPAGRPRTAKTSRSHSRRPETLRFARRTT
ncbi:Uncharacterised protein [Mycobacteroides abscessus]|nr:Uncharacterised protein [Mycobacteroides abscessus]